MKPNLKTAKTIVGTFLINVRKNPEHLVTHESGSQTCERNKLVAQCLLAIDELKESL